MWIIVGNENLIETKYRYEVRVGGSLTSSRVVQEMMLIAESGDVSRNSHFQFNSITHKILLKY